MKTLSTDQQYRQWTRIYSGASYYYGYHPGPVARRAVRYHRPHHPHGGTAIDVGCGEGQDLAFLAESGYTACGIDFTEQGLSKAQRLLDGRGLQARIEQHDLRNYRFDRAYDLVLAINSIQFMGDDASECLDRVIRGVAAGGVLGLSMFAREDKNPMVRDGIFYISLPELLQRFDWQGDGRGWQMLETAWLDQWDRKSNEPQAFVTLVAQRLPADRAVNWHQEQPGSASTNS